MLTRTIRLAAVAACAAALTAACGGDPQPDATGPDPSGATAPGPVPDNASGTTRPPSAASELDLTAEVLPDGTILVDGPQASFLMPSTNLVCLLRASGVVCQIHEKDFTPRADDLAADRAPECTPETADGLSIAGDGAAAEWTCLPEDLRGWASLATGGGWVGSGRGSTRDLGGAEHAVLPYGSTLRLADVACESRRDGVECSDLSTGRSFFLARERYGTG